MAEEIGAVERLQAYQHVNRVWRPHLSSGERDFIFYLLDNTVAWGRLTVRASVAQMARGTEWLKPAGIALRSLERIVAALVESGVVKREYFGGRVVYSINLKWSPEMVLRTPKRLSGSPKNTTETADMFDESHPIPPDWRSRFRQIGGVVSAKLADVYKEKPTREAEKESSPPRKRSGADRGVSIWAKQMAEGEPTTPDPAPAPPAPPALSAVAAIAAVQTRAAAPAKKRKLTTWDTWRSAWLATFATTPCPVWGERDNGIIRTLQKRVERPGVDWHDFLNFAVCHWRTLCAQNFGWMKQTPPPQFPSVRFLTKFADTFIGAYAEAMERDASATDTSDEAVINRMVASGMTRDAALIEIGKRRGVAEQRETLTRERGEAARLLRMAQEAQNRLERTQPVVPLRNRPQAAPRPRTAMRVGEPLPFPDIRIDTPRDEDWG